MLPLKIFRVWLSATVLVGAAFCGSRLTAQERAHSGAGLAPVYAGKSSGEDYRVVAGDVVMIDVSKNPEISRTIPVDRDGDITLPLAGVMKASGLSAMQLAGLIRGKLVGKIDRPQVTVNVVGIRGVNSSPGFMRQPILTPPSQQFRDTPSRVPRLDCGALPQGVKPA